MKNVNWLIEAVRQGDNVDFIEPLFMGIQHTMETWPNLSFEYISHVYFWIDLAMPSHARPSPVDLWLTYNKIIFILLLILEILEFQESTTIWLVKNILGNKSRSTFLPDSEIGMGSQLSQQFSFQIVFIEHKMKKNLKQIQNALFWGPFLPKYKQKWNFCKY